MVSANWRHRKYAIDLVTQQKLLMLSLSTYPHGAIFTVQRSTHLQSLYVGFPYQTSLIESKKEIKVDGF